VILAEGPRQAINALTLYAFYLAKENDGHWYDVDKYFAGNSIITTALTISTAFTVLMFAISLLMLLIAGLCYLPLLCYIQGNLKEYCCHKVDKRIAEIIKRRNKQRLAKAAALAKKEAAGDYSHLKNKKGELIAKPLPQPTLPNISLDDDDGASSIRPPPSTMTGTNDYYYAEAKTPMEYAADFNPMDYPPMPSYGQPYSHNHQQSLGSLQDDHQTIYDDEYGSTVHLASTAAPMARADTGYSYSHDTHPQGTGTPVPEYMQYQQGYPQVAQGQYAYDGHSGHYAGGDPHYGGGDPHYGGGDPHYGSGDPHRGGEDAYDYNAGQAHAM